MKFLILLLMVTLPVIGFSKPTSFLKSFNYLISTNTSNLKSCYTKALNRDKRIRGSIELKFTFEPSGAIDHIGVIERMNMQDRTLVRCLYNSIRKLPFPKTGYRSKVTINKSFNFNR